MTYGKRQTLRITIGRVLLIQHVVQSRNLPVGVRDLGMTLAGFSRLGEMAAQLGTARRLGQPFHPTR